jgi:hypothetical protein
VVQDFHRMSLYTAAGSVIIGVVVTLLVFPKFEVASTEQGAEAAVKLFATAFGFGFGWHAIVDEVAKWAGAFKDDSGK